MSNIRAQLLDLISVTRNLCTHWKQLDTRERKCVNEGRLLSEKKSSKLILKMEKIANLWWKVRTSPDCLSPVTMTTQVWLVPDGDPRGDNNPHQKRSQWQPADQHTEPIGKWGKLVFILAIFGQINSVTWQVSVVHKGKMSYWVIAMKIKMAESGYILDMWNYWICSSWVGLCMK